MYRDDVFFPLYHPKHEPGDYTVDGVTTRNYIAIEAMKALIGRMSLYNDSSEASLALEALGGTSHAITIARLAYVYADALIKANNEQ